MRKQKILAIVATCVLATSCPYTVTAGEIEKQEVTTEVYAAPGDVILSGDASATAEDHVTWQVVQNVDGKFKLIISGTGNMKESYASSRTSSCGLPEVVEEQLRATYGEDGYITEVEVRKGVISVGGLQEDRDSSTNGVPFVAGEKIERVSLPDGLVSIGDDAFKGLENLSEINIPETVTNIGYRAFKFCCKLKSIKLPDKLDTLGEGAFAHTGLTSLTLPPVKNLKTAVFSDCLNLKKVIVSEGNTTIPEYMFGSEGGWSVTPAGPEEVVLPKGLKSIGRGAFQGCERLKEIDIPEGVETIEDRAFAGCSSLKELTIPEGVKKIECNVWGRGAYGFASYGSCEKLKTIRLPHSLEEIRADAWLVFKSRVTETSFAFDTALTDIYYNGTKEEWNKVKKYKPNLEQNDVTLFVSVKGWEESDDFIDKGITIHYLESEKPSTKPTATPIPEENKAVAMQRLYHPITREHFYTKSEYEKNVLVSRGWKYEGIGWYAPEKSNTPVYRLYNAFVKDHHYTTSSYEREVLIKKYGWIDEGIGWYSDDDKSVPLYRRYCPFLKSGSHHYTPALNEAKHLLTVGWKDEGIAWYGLKEDKKK
uniref:leucine-rich repeat domain-containing protein n=1 Tax=Eubacterium cellulosolvens TaxID=29322 RepID=UPI000A799DF0|nr:leucine-rich repeat domain-containing protein [[Eubacterium] cellulosolvens]